MHACGRIICRLVASGAVNCILHCSFAYPGGNLRQVSKLCEVFVRRSSYTIHISSFEEALGFGWSIPEKRRRALIPVGYTRLQRLVDLVSGEANTSVQGALAKDLPEAFDEVEPRSALGQRNEGKARMPPVPQHRI